MTEPKVPYEKQIETILRQFNFSRVKECMDAMDWGWGWGQEVPTLGDLFFAAQKLLLDTVSSDSLGMSTGGFVVRKQDGWLSLSFEVSSYDFLYDSGEGEE
jgi:hypothetical protein